MCARRGFKARARRQRPTRCAELKRPTRRSASVRVRLGIGILHVGDFGSRLSEISKSPQVGGVTFRARRSAGPHRPESARIAPSVRTLGQVSRTGFQRAGRGWSVVVYALLVGIDDYRAPVRPLRGAVRDVHGALDTLRVIVPAGELRPLVLVDADATRSAVVDGFRRHLAAAGPGDAALFWFSGHGSQIPVPQRFAATEPSGFLQTLVCADSRRDGVPDLLDKEVGRLVSEVAARGAHVVTVVDCCHGGGATRQGAGPDPGPAALGVRWTPAPPAEALLPELDDPGHRLGNPRDDHVSLAACQVTQLAYEVPDGVGHRGVFSLMLLRTLGRPGLTYRELIARTRFLVEGEVQGQHPTVHPPVGPLPELGFLGGRVPALGPAMTLRYVHGAWHVDAGACHGLVAGPPEDPTMLGLYDDPLCRQVRVVNVLADRSVVEPVGWQPADLGAHHRVAITRIPLPRTVVAIGGPGRRSDRDAAVDFGDRADRDGRTAALVAEAVLRSGSGGGPSPHLRLAERDEPEVLADVHVTFPERGYALIRGSDGTPLDTRQQCTSVAQARRLVDRIEHIARWRRIRMLDSPWSPLNEAISVEVVEARPGERSDPVHRRPLDTGAAGAVTVTYRRGAGGRWEPPPGVFVRLRNTTDRTLYCVLLDLTDRFRMHPRLFPGAWVAPGTASALDGGLVALTLPPGRPVVPGARGLDWFKVLVAETTIDSSLFQLPRLGEPEPFRLAAPGALGGAIDRLGFTALYRDLRAGPPPRALDWGTSSVTVVTEVPDDGTRD